MVPFSRRLARRACSTVRLDADRKLPDPLRIRRNEQRLLPLVDDEARLRSVRLADMADERVVDGDEAGMLALAEKGRQLGRFLQGGVPEPIAADNDMRSGNVLRVEPCVVRLGHAVGDIFILQIVLADVDRNALG